MPRLTVADVEKNKLIREVFLKNGFTVKEGELDLKSYVYAAGRELIERAALTKWVKCSDHLPDSDCTCIVNQCDTDAVYAAKFIKNTGSFYYAVNDVFALLFDRDRVTHWMPLPSPPTEQTK